MRLYIILLYIQPEKHHFQLIFPYYRVIRIYTHILYKNKDIINSIRTFSFRLYIKYIKPFRFLAFYLSPFLLFLHVFLCNPYFSVYNRTMIDISIIKLVRKNQKISQRQLSMLSGIPQQHISDIENGKIIPRLDTFLKICKILNINIKIMYEPTK